jgi:hypothetical protein
LFNVSVTVADSDIVAYKNYQISVVDTTGKIIQTQYVSVPNCQCNGNPSSPITFTGITTGSYLIKVCAQIKTNCSVIDTAPDQPPSGTTTYYQYLTPGQTYTSATTTTPAGGYADLATVDQSGGA